MNNKLLKKYISLLFETTRYTQVPSEEIGTVRASQMSKKQVLDKTDLNKEEIFKELEKHAGPNTFIRFVSSYNEKTPSLEIHPRFMHPDTPQGIYGYPLDEESLRKFVREKKPTSDTHFTDREYFHLFRITTPHSVELTKKDGKVIADKYLGLSGLRDAKKDISNMVLNALRRLDGLHDKIRKFKSPEEPKLREAGDYMSFLRNISSYLSSVISYAEINENRKQEIFRKSADVLAIYLMKNYQYTNRADSIESKTKGFPTFLVLSSAYFISQSLQSCTRRFVTAAEANAQLLNDVGISAIIDRGTRTIPSQQSTQAFVSNLQGPDNNPSFELIGTYRNPFSL